jgi:beta-lactamase class D
MSVSSSSLGRSSHVAAGENSQEPVRSFLREHNNCEIHLQRCQQDVSSRQKNSHPTMLPCSTYKVIQRGWFYTSVIQSLESNWKTVHSQCSRHFCLNETTLSVFNFT